MRRALNWAVVSAASWSLRVFRIPGLNSPRIYALFGLSAVQPILERLSIRRAFDVAARARRRCPAYRSFLEVHGAPPLRTVADFRRLPETTKSNYIREHAIESRCVEGRIPARGVIIDESSGSSGSPNNWVRGRGERRSTRRLLHHAFRLTFQADSVFLINCFALGPWATGMNVSMSLADAAILKSIGPDRAKLDATLRTFGTGYRYVIAGYPPFIKDFIDSTTLDLTGFTLHLIVGGEGISEGLRDYLLRVFRTVHSSYGASDLEINIAVETERSIAIRRLAARMPALCRELFGRDDPPMVFQYNPFDYHVERSDKGELIFTVLRRGDAAPKVRYNIHDLGGTLTFAALASILRRHGIDPGTLPTGPALPLLFVFGRSDLTLAFYGCKLHLADFEAVLAADPAHRRAFNSFQARTSHDDQLNEVMTIALEHARGAGASGSTPDANVLSHVFYAGLAAVNQDFREVSRMFGPDRIRIEMHNFGQGPFAERDIRIKNRYLA